MAKKISQLDAASSVTSADTFVCVQSSTTKKVAGTVLLTMTDASAIVAARSALFGVSGSFASPQVITAAGGISVGSYQEEVQYVVSNGGDILVSANPQIEAGSVPGQKLTLIGTSNTNRVEMADGNGIRVNGSALLAEHAAFTFVWTGTIWLLVSANSL